mgnify:CR=1 FL=1
MLDDVVSPLFKPHCKVKVTDKQANGESSQYWFNLECYEKRKLFYRSLNEYKNNDFEVNGSSMVSVGWQTLSGQALKAIFKMNKHLYKFTSILVSHRIELFDKLILPILNYASEVWGFVHGEVIERMHLQFMKSFWELNVQRRRILFTES